MNGFLNLLARRALGPGEVRPRVAARFENAVAPLAIGPERIAEPAPAAVESPRNVAGSRPDSAAPAPAASTAFEPDRVSEPARTLTSLDLVDRVVRLAAPLTPTQASLAETAPVVASRTAAEAPRPDETVHTPPLPAIAVPAPPLLVIPPILEPGIAPLPVRTGESTTVPQTPRSELPAARASAPLPPPVIYTRAAPQPAATPAPAPAPAPIEIVIGRIEIRGVDPAPAAPARAASNSRAPSSLDDYLRSREGSR